MLMPSSSSSFKWTHDVFLSFRGEDVRKTFLSHIQKEFRSKGIIPFSDNDIKRGESIGQELIQAIGSSKIAVILLSRNYASSTWCLDELVEITKCKEESGQIMFPIFYEVDPSEVKKLTGDFGAVFQKTCADKTEEDIERWRQALTNAATTAGYDTRISDNEAVMIEKIVAETSKRFINSKPSRYKEKMKLFFGVKMDAAMGRIKQSTKVSLEGRYEKIFRQTFETGPEEQLQTSYACYLSTSAGPVMGVLYISNAKLAYCSDKPLSYKTSGLTERSYYRIVIPLHQLKSINPSANNLNPTEKYIQVISVDDYEFWFMGFLYYDEAVKSLQDTLQAGASQSV